MKHPLRAAAGAFGLLTLISACGGNDDPAPLPRLSAASGAAIAYCTELATRISFANTSITAANASRGRHAHGGRARRSARTARSPAG